MSIMPEFLNDFRVYVPGNPDIMGISDIQLPSLDPKTETVGGAGMLGEYDSPALGHLQSLKLTLNWRVISKEVITFLRLGTVELDCRLANQDYSSIAGRHKLAPNRVYLRGIPIKNDLGKAAKGSPYEGSTEIEILHLKVESEGVTMVEVDKINYIYKVDGVDQLKELREALGM